MPGRSRRRAAFLAVLSGSILLAGHFSAATRWRSFIDVIEGFVEVTPALRVLFLAVILIASAGGATVILGGLLIIEGRILLARLLILLGTGFGLFSFLLALILAGYRGDLGASSRAVAVLSGIGLSVLARYLARD
jgi:hypothetical protein